MESKIFIDILQGEPQIRIDYKHAGERDDVRDKLIGSFISGLFVGKDTAQQIDVSLEFGHEDDNGVVAFIRLKKDPSPMVSADKWCVLNLPPDLYKKWTDEVIYHKS